MPNLHIHRFWVESENRWVKLRVSTQGIRIIDKKGIDSVLADLYKRGVKVWCRQPEVAPNGKGGPWKNKTGVECGHWPLLYNEQKQAHHDHQTWSEKIWPGRA